ncbi:hypothetical protein FS935_04215 [Metabacillus litoralis]|uniref:Intracellular proteinase inhibitor BsuPI domain-containing protein n=2 Tax=Metabacillus litoralis TaxID=152268 RepID=A0A5C6WA68_9BACI|nr:hypothetical protein FS935_04215 [Metabacillus litoralis]
MKMLKKNWFIFLIITILAGCGTGNTNSNTENEGSKNGDDKQIIAGEMVASLTESSPLHYTYKVKNQTEEVEKMEFTSSQRVDYQVLTKDGEEIFLFSSTASFLAALGSEEIKPGEEFTYDINLSELNLSSGEYELSVWMTPKEGKKYEVSKNFIVN